jgi:hypothetical protein
MVAGPRPLGVRLGVALVRVPEGAESQRPLLAPISMIAAIDSGNGTSMVVGPRPLGGPSYAPFMRL